MLIKISYPNSPNLLHGYDFLCFWIINEFEKKRNQIPRKKYDLGGPSYD